MSCQEHADDLQLHHIVNGYAEGLVGVSSAAGCTASSICIYGFVQIQVETCICI